MPRNAAARAVEPESVLEPDAEPVEVGPFILRLKGDERPYSGTGLYETREEAAAYGGMTWGVAQFARYLKGGELVLEKATYRLRESARFNSGTYVAPIWHAEPWWLGSEPSRDHYAHPALGAPDSIAFTENESKGERDIQARMRPGKYLKRFFGDVLTDKQVAYYAEWWRRGERPPMAWEGVELGFADTPESIARVYAYGPDSCMAGKHFDYEQQPTRVYGAGDLAVAFLKGATPDTYDDDNGEENEPEYIARALVYPANKAMSRLYGLGGTLSDGGSFSREDAANELEARLKNIGYRSIYAEGNGLFEGARLLAIKDEDNGAGCYVMPYIDKLRISTRPEGGFFRIRDTGRCADSTGGEFYAEPWGRCYECEAHLDGPDDATEAHTSYDGSQPYDLVNLCERCGEDTFHCEGSGETFTGDQIEMADGATWSREYFGYHGFRCSYSDEHYPLAEQSDIWPGCHRDHDLDADAHPELVTQALNAAGFHAPPTPAELLQALRIALPMGDPWTDRDTARALTSAGFSNPTQGATVNIYSVSGRILFTATVSETTGRPLRDALVAAVVSGVSLYGANLYGADLSGVSLSGANLSGADLSRANLSRANLSGVSLSRANLSHANLYGADLSGVSLSGANLSGADLSRANLSRANLSGADLSRANLSRANLSHANLSRADLSGVSLSGADLSGVSLYGANLYGANLSGANLYGANLSGADLSGVSLSGALNAARAREIQAAQTAPQATYGNTPAAYSYTSSNGQLRDSQGRFVSTEGL